MKSLFFAVCLLLGFATASPAAKHDTSFRFSTIETPHFSVHFHQGLEPLGQKASIIAEEVHGRLAKEFGWQPAEKTQLVLLDDSQFADGLTVTIPYNMIYLHVEPPAVALGMGEYDDWLKLLITHEYTHVLTSDPARGFWKFTRAVFGKPLPPLDPIAALFFIATAPPNTFMPRWWHEGMATWSESEFTGGGRGKGSYFDMVFRAAVAEGNLPTVDLINGDAPNWPDGDLPYLYGYRLQKYIADTYGKDAPGKLSLGHSGRFPYLIDGPPAELFQGLGYAELYANMLVAVKREQGERIAQLSRVPFTPLTTLATLGENLTNPRLSPDASRLAFTRRDPHRHTEVVVTDKSGGRTIASFRRRASDESLCWSPDGSKLYFTQAEVRSGFDVYQDLYAYDFATGSTVRLTHGKRLGNVEISPDGKLFAAVVSSRGSQNVALIDALAPDQGSALRLITDYRLERLSAAHWSPDGSTLCYAVRDNAGVSSLRLYDPKGGADRTLFSLGHTLTDPVWSRDGSCIFYISDETGVFNLFAFDLKEQKSYQVSHLLTGALQPDPTPDGRAIVLSHYGSRGFNIARLELDRAGWTEKRGPSLPLTRTVATAGAAGAAHGVEVAGAAGAAHKMDAMDGVDTARKGTLTETGKRVEGAADYRALKTLYPRFWLPHVSSDGSGTAVVGAYTAGADVLGYHSYVVSADYGTGRKRGYADLTYQNDCFYPTFTLHAYSEPLEYANLLQRGADYFELDQSVTLKASVPLNFLESHYSANAGYQVLDQKALSTLDGNEQFNGIGVFQGRRDNVFAGISFDNTLKYPYSISPEEGRTIALLYRRSIREIGSDLNLSEYHADYQEFLGLPGETLRHHVLYLRLSGAAANGDRKFDQEAFHIGGVQSDLNPFPLRGYQDRSLAGKYVATGTLEYRAPLFTPMRGPGTLPAFLEQVHGALFVDAGELWGGPGTNSGLTIGAGFEARTDVTIGYWLKLTPAVGIAHGFNQGGENQIYFTVYLNM